MKQDATATTLLRAGRRLFARHGYDGASVRAIASAARANLGAITYHFGSKRKLYDAVLESAATPLADAAIAATRSTGTAMQRVAAVVRTYFEQLANDPDIARLMTQEFVIGHTAPASTALPLRRIHGALTELVIEGQASGEFRAGDPALMAISIISQPVHMNLVRQPLKALGDVDFDHPETRQRLIRHVTEFACAGLAHEDAS
ncbi:MAG: TetR/AcrR family transcriptional regulator [Gemmatimonadota bacterium]